MIKPISIMASLFSTLFGAGRKNKKEDNPNIFPEEKFSVIQASLTNGQPVVGSINLAYKDYNKKAQYPWCLKLAIGLDLDGCYENGLPKDDENKIASKLEEELLVEINKLATAHY